MVRCCTELIFKLNTKNMDKNINEKQEQCTIHIVIGSVYAQIITGTVFKQKVLKHLGSFNGYEYYLVENVETGFRHTMIGDDLHCL